MKIRAVLLAVLATTLAATMPLHAVQQGVNPNGPYDFTHVVPVSVGRTVVQPGDKIVIDAIHGSADKLTAGNIYQVDGHYTLGSKDAASIGVSVVSSDTAQHPDVKNGTVSVTRGEGTFTVYFYMWHEGNPYINFYINGKSDQSFGAVYFNGKDAWGRKS